MLGVTKGGEDIMHRLKINLIKQNDVLDFANIMSNVPGEAVLVGTDGNTSCTVNARSIVGALYAMTWNDVTLVSDEDVYMKIKKFVIE